MKSSVEFDTLKEVKVKLSSKEYLMCEMRVFGILVFFCIAAVVSPRPASGGTCEKIEKLYWFGKIGIAETCYMHSIAINSRDFSITSDRNVTVNVTAINAIDNKNLKYLPINLGEKFPKLLKLAAAWCSIKEISKHNFEGLSELRYLNLYSNQIEKIDKDTFAFIPKVEEINLYRNKIKKLNSRAFESLPKLTRVGLTTNECIDEDFLTALRIAEMPQVLTEKCDGSMAQSQN